MTSKFKGIFLGITAAICYGTNPLGALSLYHEGLNTVSTVFLRYFTAVLILGTIMVAKSENFIITKSDIRKTTLLGTMFGLSSLTLYYSFNFMDSGLASTILFCYPVMVSVIMTIWFKEKITKNIFFSLVLSLTGIILLSKGGANSSVSTIGIILVLLSSLTYAIYIVLVNKAKIQLSVLKFTFFATLFSLPAFIIFSFIGGEENHLQFIFNAKVCFWGFFLGLVPTVLSLICMNTAIKLVGSTPAAIMGSLEPVTAVLIGIFIFNELFTAKLFFGILLILLSVILIVKNQNATVKKKS